MIGYRDKGYRKIWIWWEQHWVVQVNDLISWNCFPKMFNALSILLSAWSSWLFPPRLLYIQKQGKHRSLKIRQGRKSCVSCQEESLARISVHTKIKLIIQKKTHAEISAKKILKLNLSFLKLTFSLANNTARENKMS